MFYHPKTKKYITTDSQFNIDGTTYPAGWLTSLSTEEKDNLGLVEVSVVGQREDERFYWVSETLEEATKTITNTPKNLTQLKTEWKVQIKESANKILQPSDWMAVRAVEISTPIPDDWKTWRQSVRTTCGNIIQNIDAANNVEELKNTISQINWPKPPLSLSSQPN